MMHVPSWQDSELFCWVQPIGYWYRLSDLHRVPVSTNPAETQCCQKIVLRTTPTYELKISPQITFPHVRINPSNVICHIDGFRVMRPRPGEVSPTIYLLIHPPSSPLGTLSYRTLFFNGNMLRGSPIKQKSRLSHPKTVRFSFKSVSPHTFITNRDPMLPPRFRQQSHLPHTLGGLPQGIIFRN